MKFCVYLFLLLTMAACGVTKINSAYFPYSPELDFKVEKAANVAFTEGVAANWNVTYIAGKNVRFKRVILEFKNKSTIDQEIDFSEIYMLDQAGNKYEAKFAAQLYRATTNTQKLTRQIRANQTRSFLVEFFPPFPKDEAIERFLVKGEVVDLK